MKEYPLLFQADMVRAILAGRYLVQAKRLHPNVLRTLQITANVVRNNFRKELKNDIKRTI